MFFSQNVFGRSCRKPWFLEGFQWARNDLAVCWNFQSPNLPGNVHRLGAHICVCRCGPSLWVAIFVLGNGGSGSRWSDEIGQVLKLTKFWRYSKVRWHSRSVKFITQHYYCNRMLLQDFCTIFLALMIFSRGHCWCRPHPDHRCSPNAAGGLERMVMIFRPFLTWWAVSSLKGSQM